MFCSLSSIWGHWHCCWVFTKIFLYIKKNCQLLTHVCCNFIRHFTYSLIHSTFLIIGFSTSSIISKEAEKNQVNPFSCLVIPSISIFSFIKSIKQINIKYAEKCKLYLELNGLMNSFLYIIDWLRWLTFFWDICVYVILIFISFSFPWDAIVCRFFWCWKLFSFILCVYVCV